MLLRICHETRLSYSEPVSETVFEVRMAPTSSEDQTTLGYRLQLVPAVAVTAYRDGFGNRVDLFNLLTPCKEIVVRATSLVQTHRRPAPARLAGVAYAAQLDADPESVEFLRPSPLVRQDGPVTEFVQSLGTIDGPLDAVALRLVEAVRARLKYEKKVTTARTPVSEALELGRGVCQDFSHLFLAACRGIGLPARYVSGYVNQPGEIATHAWCQVWGGSVGWVDVDPTHGKFVEANHVAMAFGRDYSDVPPNRGVWKGNAEETIAVSVKVEPLERMPPEWADLNDQQAWSGATLSRSHRRPRPGGFSKTQYRHQQSQQQQVPR